MKLDNKIGYIKMKFFAIANFQHTISIVIELL